MLPPRRVDLVPLAVWPRAGSGTAAPPCRALRAPCTPAGVPLPGPDAPCGRLYYVAACGTGLARARHRRSGHGWPLLRPSGGPTRVRSLPRSMCERWCKRRRWRGVVCFVLALCWELGPDDAAPRPARGAQGTLPATGPPRRGARRPLRWGEASTPGRSARASWARPSGRLCCVGRRDAAWLGVAAVRRACHGWGSAPRLGPPWATDGPHPGWHRHRPPDAGGAARGPAPPRRRGARGPADGGTATARCVSGLAVLCESVHRLRGR